MKWNRCKPLSDVGVYVGGPGAPVGGYVELRKWHRWKYRKRGRTYTVKRRGVALYLSPAEFHLRFQGMGSELYRASADEHGDGGAVRGVVAE